MRLAWSEIQEKYPDQWVLMKDMEFNNYNLEYAVVVYAAKTDREIFVFEETNPELSLEHGGVWYTGEPIDVEYYNTEPPILKLAEIAT